MYGALWRALPGPWLVKLLLVLAMTAAVVYGLFFYAFPYASQFINPQEVTVG